MAAFHKVEVALNKQSITVGAPSPQTVNVVVPRIGPKGDQGEIGMTGSTGATGATGAPGADGREVELQTTDTHVQWRYEGDVAWTNLIALSAITGPQGVQGEVGNTGATGAAGADGREVELQKTATHVQWRYEGDVAWTDLIPLADITGPQGPAGTQTTDASLLTSGTLADARLSSNVARRDASNTFSANQTLNGTNNVAPNQTAASGSSVMTRDLGDGRYAKIFTATRSTSVNLADTNYVVVLTFANVPAGTYALSGLLPTYGGNNSSGVRRRIVGNTATITGRRGYYFNYSNAFIGVSNIASEQLLAGAASTPALPIYGTIVVSVGGSIDLEAAQNTSQATPSIFQAEAHLILTELP
jgi:hypothetical protein